MFVVQFVYPGGHQFRGTRKCVKCTIKQADTRLKILSSRARVSARNYARLSVSKAIDFSRDPFYVSWSVRNVFLLLR